MKNALIIILIILWGSIYAQASEMAESYLQESKGNYELALQSMQRLKAKEPSDAFYQIRIAWLEYLLGQYDASLESYLAALQLKEHLDARIGVINCLLALGRYQELLGKVDTLLVAHPENQILLAKGAYAAYLAKDYRKAAEYYQKIIDISPWDMESRGYLVNNLFLAGKEVEALRQLRLLLKYYPHSSIIELYKDRLK
ncbi:MAG: tetratricopeptide repeat protein [Candidatus Cloacimonadaceae bacterium]